MFFLLINVHTSFVISLCCVIIIKQKNMLDPWNAKTILQPPVHTTLTSKQIDVDDIKHVCKNILRTLSKQSPLHKESALLSRFLYKYDKKFRNDIGFTKFKKVNTALRKYLMLDLIKDVTNFFDALPTKDDMYLPTKQMLQYVLIRLMTFSKLMLRINVCSKQAAIFYLYRIKSGESHWMSLMPYSLLSRIWSLSLVLLKHSCNWYNRLLPFVNELELKGLDFLPVGYELPENLSDWLDLKCVDDEGRFNWTQKISTNIDTSLVENEDGDLCDNILQYVDNINTEEDSPDVEMLIIKPEMNIKATVYQNDDKGEAVSRDSFNKVDQVPTTSLNNELPTKINDNKQLKDHDFTNVINRDTLREFLNNETNYRNNSSELSVTSHLSFMQWQALRTSLLKLDKDVINHIKLQKKAKKIWQEKCLDYL